MCGRFSQSYTWDQIAGFARPLTLAADRGAPQPRYNIAPSTLIDIITATPAGRVLQQARWGRVPIWWSRPLDDAAEGIVARVETIDTHPAFAEAYQRRRCIIPASGFFEWTGEGDDRTPHYISASDGSMLAFAGLMERERWVNSQGEPIVSCTMLVREKSASSSDYLDGLPCMLAPSEFGGWLSGTIGKDVLMRQPRPLRHWAVSPRINSSEDGDSDPRTIEPITT